MNATPDNDASAADVLIVGAGPAGLALACALADAGLRPTLVERQSRDTLDQPSDDGREIAVTHRARGVMQALGLWSRLPADAIAPLHEARVVDGGGGALTLGAGSAEVLGWLVPNHAIRRAALEAALARPTVQLLTDARVTELDRSGALAWLTLADGRRLGAPLVVAADSRFSDTRRLAGIGAEMRDFGRSVVVGCVEHQHEHGGIAWEIFGYGNTLALLPLNARRCSAVVTLASDQASAWLALDDDTFAERIAAQAGGRLGRVRSLGARHHYPLVGVYAQRFVAPRFALVGDAAVGMHPVTAHGWNFGLYGIEVLARELASAQRASADPGALPALLAYERTHRLATRPVYIGTNAIVSLFTDTRGPARLARSAVLAVVEHLPALNSLVKSAITAQLTGRRPVLPPWAVAIGARVSAALR